MNTNIIVGHKLILKKTSVEHISKVIDFENINKKFVHSYTREVHIRLLTDDNCLHLSILKKNDNKLIGHIILFGLVNPNKVLEFRRITVLESGCGYGREAIQLIKQHCFENLHYHRLWLDVYDDNYIAIALYESEGFQLEGVLRENIKSDSGYRSQRIYSMLESEYKNS